MEAQRGQQLRSQGLGETLHSFKGGSWVFRDVWSPGCRVKGPWAEAGWRKGRVWRYGEQCFWAGPPKKVGAMQSVRGSGPIDLLFRESWAGGAG